MGQHHEAEELLNVIRKSPTAFHAAKILSGLLKDAGFTELSELGRWELRPGGAYLVTRNQSAFLAFRIPEEAGGGKPVFQIIASHSDSPSLKLKEHPEYPMEKAYVRLNVERYGGLLAAPWFDRPLSVAGRVFLDDGGSIRPVLVDIDRDFLIIPNLAIHMNRQVNEGYSYNAQKDLIPLYGMYGEGKSFSEEIREAAEEASGVKIGDGQILGMDLFLYNRMSGSVWGPDGCFLSAPRLDDLECAFASVKGLAAADEGPSVRIAAVFDNEEVGSETRQGAAGSFLYDTLYRIGRCLGMDDEAFRQAVAGSFMVSADNAHALHPNYPEKTDPVNRPVINRGIVVKHSANQRYTTDGLSAAVFRKIAARAGLKTQDFLNRSDILGGSTLGNKSVTQVSLSTVDIGLAQLAMHSPYETAGTRDLKDLITASETFFRTGIRMNPDGGFTLE